MPLLAQFPFDGLHQARLHVIGDILRLHALVHLNGPFRSIEDNEAIRTLGDVSLNAAAETRVSSLVEIIV